MEQELNQEGAAREKAPEKLEATSTATSTEEKATSEKVRTEDEFRNIQSMKDKADARATKAEALVTSVQSELQEFRNEIERQKQVTQQKEIDSLVDDPDAQSKLRRIYQREAAIGKSETELQKKADGLTKKWNHAIDLATQYNVDVNELLITDSPELMEKMAKLMAQNKVGEQAKNETKTPEVSGETFSPDSGTSDAGADSDTTFQEKWNSGEMPATKENLARAEKIINK